METISATLKGNDTYFLKIWPPVLVHLPNEMSDLVQRGRLNLQSESQLKNLLVKLPFSFLFMNFSSFFSSFSEN